LYRVIENNSQEKKAHHVELFGDVFFASRGCTMAIIAVSFAAPSIIFFAPSSDPYEYWRFSSVDFLAMKRCVSSFRLHERRKAFLHGPTP